MLMGGGAILYFTGMGPIQRALQRLVALALPTPVRAGAAGQADAAGQAAPPPQWSLLGELQAIIVGFFSSLIPGDAAAARAYNVTWEAGLINACIARLAQTLHIEVALAATCMLTSLALPWHGKHCFLVLSLSAVLMLLGLQDGT